MVRSERNMSLKNIVTPPGIDPGTVQLGEQRHNHYAIPGPGCDPEGFSRFILPDFHDFRQMKMGRSSTSRTGRLYPQMLLVLIFTTGPGVMVRSEGNMSLKNIVTPPGIDPGTVRLVAQSLNHYATEDIRHELYESGHNVRNIINT